MILSATTAAAWLIYGTATSDGVVQHMFMSKHPSWAWCNSRRADMTKLLNSEDHIRMREQDGVVISIMPDCVMKKPREWREPKSKGVE